VATDQNELRTTYTNFALKPGDHAVAAPGGDSIGFGCGSGIVSSVPVGTGYGYCPYGKDYEEMVGTSMATPHVAGVAALLMAQGRSDDDVLRILEETARDPGSEDARGTYDPVYGYGIVDAAAAVAAPGAVAPPPPQPATAPAAAVQPAPATLQPAAKKATKKRGRRACRTRRKAQRGKALAKGRSKANRGHGRRTRRCARRRA
jgi:subtilisin family serine protease